MSHECGGCTAPCEGARRSSTLLWLAMRIDKKDLEKINERMKGWTVDRVSSGSGEKLFIFHLSKGKNKRTVILGANDLGGWLER